MRVAIAGSSGLIGTPLVPALISKGHDVLRMVRHPTTDNASEIVWDPMRRELAPEALDGVDAVINLAGRGVADARWSEAQRQSILDSRVNGNQVIADAIGQLRDSPKTLVAGSAIGFYGDTGASIATETSPSGADFLASVCVALENAASPASGHGCRVVYARTGIVLSASGGALGQILPFFRAGIGGRIGHGDQFWSWISLHDEVAALVHLLESELSGPVNLVAPGAVTNAEFTRILGRVLRRPTFLPTPKAALWARLGRQLTDALLYTSTRVEPSALIHDDFEFEHPDLESALRAILRGTATDSPIGDSG